MSLENPNVCIPVKNTYCYTVEITYTSDWAFEHNGEQTFGMGKPQRGNQLGYDNNMQSMGPNEDGWKSQTTPGFDQEYYNAQQQFEVEVANSTEDKLAHTEIGPPDRNNSKDNGFIKKYKRDTQWQICGEYDGAASVNYCAGDAQKEFGGNWTITDTTMTSDTGWVPEF